MKKLFTITAVLLLCVCFVAAQTPATPQTSTTAQQPDITKPMLEFANANSAKIAWTSKQGADLDMHYGTDRNNMTGAVNAIEKMGGDNHRASLINLQPNTTYFVQMTNKTGQPVGPVYTFKTPAQGQPPIHEQPLSPQ
jgi:hypothetical protein